MISEKEFSILTIVLVGLPALVTAVLSFIGLLVSLQAQKQANSAHEKVAAISIVVNGRLDQILGRLETSKKDP